MSTFSVRRADENSTAVGVCVGIIAGAIASLVLLLIRLAFGGPSLFEVVSEGLVQLLPGQVFSTVLDQLRFTGKPLLFTLVQIGSLGVAAALGVYYNKNLGESVPEVHTTWLKSGIGTSVNVPETPLQRAVDDTVYPIRKALVFGLILFVILGGAILPLLGVGFFGSSRSSDVPLWAATLIATAAFTFVLRTGASISLAMADTSPPAEATSSIHRWGAQRRVALNALAGGAVLSIGSVLAWSALRTTPATGVDLAAGTGSTSRSNEPDAPPSPLNGHPTSEITKVGVFYNVSKNFIDPIVTDANWKVQFTGNVNNPFSIGLDELKALPAVERQHTLGCISNEVGGDLIGNGQWRGVRFADLLEQAGLKAGSQKVVFHCRDDYRDSITVEAARNPDTLFAYEMNGEPLTNKHGFPARILIPGIYGMKNVKWLDKVEILPSPFLGFWQSQGWSDPAPYLTMSRIDWPTRAGVRFVPKPTTLYGVAYAGDRGIAKVELTVDGGATWAPAKIVSGGQPNVWARWAFDWVPEPGRQAVVKVRATDRQGGAQIETKHDPFPDGATGYHSLTISVANV